MGNKWKPSLEMWTGKMGQLASVWYVWMQLWWAWECVWGWCLHFKWMLKKKKNQFQRILSGNDRRNTECFSCLFETAFNVQGSLIAISDQNLYSGMICGSAPVCRKGQKLGKVTVKSSLSLKGEQLLFADLTWMFLTSSCFHSRGLSREVNKRNKKPIANSS